MKTLWWRYSQRLVLPKPSSIIIKINFSRPHDESPLCFGLGIMRMARPGADNTRRVNQFLSLLSHKRPIRAVRLALVSLLSLSLAMRCWTSSRAKIEILIWKSLEKLPRRDWDLYSNSNKPFARVVCNKHQEATTRKTTNGGNFLKQKEEDKADNEGSQRCSIGVGLWLESRENLSWLHAVKITLWLPT